jgi:hypothetical protein
MKKLILLALFGLSLVGCDNSVSDDSRAKHIADDSRVTHIADSTKHSLFLIDNAKKDSIFKMKEKQIAANKDSFDKSPIGRALKIKNKILEKIMDKYNCSEDDAELFLERRIWIGMTYKMLVSYRGLPNSINTSNYGNGERYQACWYNYSPSCFYFTETQIITAYN